MNEIGHITTILVAPLSILAFSKHCSNIVSEFITLILLQYLSILHSKLTPFILLILLFVMIFNYKKMSKINLNQTNTENPSTIADDKRLLTDNKLQSNSNNKLQSKPNNLQLKSNNIIANYSTTTNDRIIFDLSRFITIVQTTICIFLCDFNFWNPEFSKNDHFEIGLMDLGVGCFIFNSAVLSSKIPKKKLIRNSIMMFLLGVIRLGVVKIFNLDVNPNEYGYHWNFYFTLSTVTILFALIDIFKSYINTTTQCLFNKTRQSLLNTTKRSFKKVNFCVFNKTIQCVFNKTKCLFNLIVGILILIFYEMKSNTVISTIFNEKRDNLFMMNKEGIFSVFPFLGFFLILNYLGPFILNNKIKHIWIVNTLVHLVTRLNSSPSRRICNVSYLSWILFIQTTILSIFKYLVRPELVGSLKLYRFISQNMLEIFLLSNLLVLIFKLTFDVYEMGYLRGNVLNIVYLGVNFILLPLFKNGLFSFKKQKPQ